MKRPSLCLWEVCFRKLFYNEIFVCSNIVKTQYCRGKIAIYKDYETQKQLYMLFTNTLYHTGLEAYISVEASTDVPKAGEDFTLTCRAFGDKPTQLMWMGTNGLPVNGENLFVHSQITNGKITSVNLRFNKLRTSQAGVYTCVSVIGSSRKNESILVKIESELILQMYLHHCTQYAYCGTFCGQFLHRA